MLNTPRSPDLHRRPNLYHLYQLYQYPKVPTNGPTHGYNHLRHLSI